ncbi:MAG: DUF1320 domain-containing protein [Methylococcales bacterium]
MSYCTQADLLEVFQDSQQELIQLTDTNNTGAINTAVLNQKIARVDAEINRYLMAYLPLAAVPADLVYLACDMVRYYLYGDQMIPHVETRYNAAVQYLKDVRDEKYPLSPTVTGVIEQPVYDSVDYVIGLPDTFGKEGY